MRRRPLTVCCTVLLTCLSPCLESRTVSPVLYLTTAEPDSAYDWSAYGGGSLAHHEPATYGSISSARHDPATYGSSSSARHEPAGYGYGHRSMPSPLEREPGRTTNVRRGRDDDDGRSHHALYELPKTYSYMKNPGKSERSRVPDTENRPPGDDDVETIGGGGGNGRIRDYDRPAVDYDDTETRTKRMKKKKKKKKKKKRKTTGANEDDGWVADPEAWPSSSSKRSKTSSARPGSNGGPKKNDGRVRMKNGKNAEVIAVDGPGVKHRVHKKNEYTKKQQFFDEEHVDHGKKKPSAGTAAVSAAIRKNKVHKNRPTGEKHRSAKHGGHATRKRQRRAKEKPVRDDRVAERRSNGYGQVLAVR